MLGVEGGSFGRKLALRVHRKQPGVPVYYPTTIIAGSTYPQAPPRPLASLNRSP